MKNRLGFLVDTKKCIGCHSCAMICKSLHRSRPGVVRRRLHALGPAAYLHHERAFYTLSCHHCAHPACADACFADAYEIRKENGIVLHHPEKCVGCRACVPACPYGAVQFDREKRKVEKCDFCRERLEAEQQPACVQACPTEALTLINITGDIPSSAEQFPPGFPFHPDLDPSIRFLPPGIPQIIARAPLDPSPYVRELQPSHRSGRRLGVPRAD